jgi:hypothetical protein
MAEFWNPTSHTRSAGSYRTRPTWRQHSVLVPEYQQLSILRPVAAEHQDGRAECSACQHVDDLE